MIHIWLKVGDHMEMEVGLEVGGDALQLWLFSVNVEQLFAGLIPA